MVIFRLTLTRELLRRLLFILICGVAATAVAQEGPIVVDPTVPRGSNIEVELSGFKRFPEDIFSFQKGHKIGFPTALLYEAFQASPEISSKAAQSGFNFTEKSPEELLRFIRQNRPALNSPDSAFPLNKHYVDLGGGYTVDPNFLLALVNSELIQDDPLIFSGEMVAGSAEMLSINQEVGHTFSETYSALAIARYMDSEERIDIVNDGLLHLAAYPMLLDASKIKFSSVSMGKILSFPAAEKDLKLEPSLSRRYDVYWIEFPLTLRDLQLDSVSEVGFHIILPEDSIALQLIPTRFGTEVAVTENLSSPEITAESGGMSLTVGEFWGRTVEYTLLKPTIVATGIRDSKFSWFLSGNALGTGSYIFVGIIGVPKGKTTITAGFSVEGTVESF